MDDFLNAICEGRLREVNEKWPLAFQDSKFDDFEKWIANQNESTAISFQFYCPSEGVWECIFFGPPDYIDGCLKFKDMKTSRPSEIPQPEFQFGRIFGG